MSKVENLLTSEQEKQLIKAIQAAELNTSGEIRVHLESGSDEPAIERAKVLFHELGMDATQLRNGILIYIDVANKQLAILGDAGIDALVPADFWQSEIDLMTTYFKKGEYTEGLILAIAEVGHKLKQFFPYQSDDTNELSDEISKGE